MTSNLALKRSNADLIREQREWLQGATYKQALAFYGEVCGHPSCDNETLAELGRIDRFFLLTHLLKRHDAIHPWLYARCREVEANTDGYLDLWAREHYKSTIITFAGTIQEIIKDPEITIGIFSHTRPAAKSFLTQIKREMEGNEFLKTLYPDVFWSNPEGEAPTWSLDSGLVVKRKTNPKEATLEAWGLVDGQPTGKHFRLLEFDDVVTLASVSTPDQIAKTTEAWEMAQHLGAGDNRRKWHIGTRYNFADTYHELLERNAIKPRIYAATDTGTVDGKPVFLTAENWARINRESSLYTIACQMLQNPNAGGEQEFKPEWIRRYEVRPKTLNVYILCDYAGSRKSTGSSNTAYVVIGVDHAMNKYVLDGAVHKMSLEERWTLLKNIRNRWVREPGVQHVKVGYERFGAQSDIEHFEAMMKVEGNYFAIEELNWPRDGDVAKDNRIRRLEPDHRNWRFFYPVEGEMTTLQRKAKERGEEYLIAKPIKRKNHEGHIYNVVEWFLRNEYLFFPNTTMKDFFDAMSRIYDIDISAPQILNEADTMPQAFED